MGTCEELQYYQLGLIFIVLVGGFFYYRQYVRLKELAESENSLLDEVYFDAVTKLPNHKNVEIILNDQISRCQRHKKSFFVAYVKIDNLDKIFKSNSIEKANEMLQKAGDSIFNSIRDEDLVGHVTRNGFIILFNEYLGQDNLEYIYKRLNDSLKDDFEISIGLSKFPNDSQDAQSLIDYSLQASKKVDEKDTYHSHLYKQD